MSKNKLLIQLLSNEVQLKIEELSLNENIVLATALIFAMAEVEAANTTALGGKDFSTPEQAHELLANACEAALDLINNLLDTIESQQEVKH